jgi:hypothetical protein
MMTVSALCRLRPCPPALVDSMKTKAGESRALNCETRRCRSSALVLPSSRCREGATVRTDHNAPDALRRACQVGVTAVLEELLEHVHRAGHLRVHSSRMSFGGTIERTQHLVEEQHAMAGGLQLGQQLIQQQDLRHQ